MSRGLQHLRLHRQFRPLPSAGKNIVIPAVEYRERDVAIKVLRISSVARIFDTMVKRFEQEARLISQLRDPHTITLHDYGKLEDGSLYMVFEYIDGQSLKDVIEQEGRVAPERVARIMLQTLASLQEAHEAIRPTDFGKDIIVYFESTKNLPSWNNTIIAILLLLEGFAVFLIFQMKRNGFWLYLVAQIGFLVHTYSVLPFPNMMSMSALVVTFLIIAVFTILYAVNLKHLRN